MNWKFWKWDVTGRKRIARLEERITELEKEVGISASADSVYNLITRSFFTRMWGGHEEKPIRLHDKVSRIQRHLKISIERGSCDIVVKKLRDR